MMTPAESPEPVSTFHCLRVLLVDDMPQVLHDLQQLLELSGKVEVVGLALDGAEAVRQARLTTPDVILMDLEMPGMDGFEATRRIKSESPGLRVIILSVHNGISAQSHAREAGADGYIIKGTDYEVLLKALFSKNPAFDEI
jgi:DNA-binding NarL/FixJ family response regulator